MTHRLCLIHQIDPRGSKVGGVETHVRQLVRRAPDDFKILIVGVDGRGDLELGTLNEVTFEGRTISFLPIVAHPEATITQAATRLHKSMTLKMVLGAMRNLRAISSWFGNGPASIEIERYEYAIVAKLLRRPFVAMVHSDARNNATKESLLNRHSKIHGATENVAVKLASRVFCVEPGITKRLMDAYPAHADKLNTMSVSVDTEIFRPTPFDTSDGVYRMMYFGRLDEFKDPPAMMAVVAELRARMGEAFEFHYAGADDLSQIAGYAGAQPAIIHHGIQNHEGIKQLISRCHTVLFTSVSEGLPCLLLETIASGRTAAAFHLANFDPLIVPNISGVQVPRAPAPAKATQDLANSAFTLWQGICEEVFDPGQISKLAKPYSVNDQLSLLFKTHRAIAQTRFHEPSKPVGELERSS